MERYFKQNKPEKFKYKLYDQLYKGISKHKRVKDEDFISLIASFEEKGYDNEFPISVGKKEGYLCGGSHRIACCLWFGIDEIPIVVHRKCKRKPERYSSNWMKSHGFQNDMAEIKKVKKMVFKKIGIHKWKPIA